MAFMYFVCLSPNQECRIIMDKERGERERERERERESII
jgi:hypothetical protein